MKTGDIIQFGGYNWCVLCVQHNKLLLITENAVEKRPLHNVLENTSWSECDLRKYLNDEFYNKFARSEKNTIIQVTNKNYANPWFERAKSGNNTSDKVFLLSLDEVVQYFGDSGDLRNQKGWFYDEKKGEYELGKGGTFVNDEYNNMRMTKFKGKPCSWWLRTFGSHDQSAVTINKDGCIIVHGNAVNTTNWGGGNGIRPALWLNTNQFTTIS